MAKVTNCAFCGKEVTSGLFKGDAEYLNVGLRILNCCEECHKKYEAEFEQYKERFEVKLENLQKSKKGKISSPDLAKMFVQYIDEAKQYEESSREKSVDLFTAFYGHNSNGEQHFSVKEFGKGLSSSDVTPKDMVKSISASCDEAEESATFFDKNDITKIEYAKTGVGYQLGLFTAAYSFAIRLNDESVMTYKPCITRAAFIGHGFGFGYRRSAEKKLIKVLNEFKKTIGSDLPIVKVRKI